MTKTAAIYARASSDCQQESGAITSQTALCGKVPGSAGTSCSLNGSSRTTGSGSRRRSRANR